MRGAIFILEIFLFIVQISFILSTHILKKIPLLSKRSICFSPRIFEERKVDLFAFNEVYRIVCLAYYIYFFFSMDPLPFFCAPLGAYSSPGEFNITKRNCRQCTGSRPAQEGCPRCAIVSIPSASRMIHRCRGFAVAADAATASVAAVRQHMRLRMTC